MRHCTRRTQVSQVAAPDLRPCIRTAHVSALIMQELEPAWLQSLALKSSSVGSTQVSTLSAKVIPRVRFVTVLLFFFCLYSTCHDACLCPCNCHCLHCCHCDCHGLHADSNQLPFKIQVMPLVNDCLPFLHLVVFSALFLSLSLSSCSCCASNCLPPSICIAAASSNPVVCLAVDSHFKL